MAFGGLWRLISDIAESGHKIRQNEVSRSFDVNKCQNSQKGQTLIFLQRRKIIPQNKTLELISTGGGYKVQQVGVYKVQHFGSLRSLFYRDREVGVNKVHLF